LYWVWGAIDKKGGGVEKKMGEMIAHIKQIYTFAAMKNEKCGHTPTANE
jgi:hypothetical protein